AHLLEPRALRRPRDAGAGRNRRPPAAHPRDGRLAVEWLVVFLFLLFFLLSLAGVAVWIWALIDCIQVPDDGLYESGNKLVWVLIIVFLNVIGAILYLAIGRPRGVSGIQRASGDGHLPPPPPPGSV